MTRACEGSAAEPGDIPVVDYAATVAREYPTVLDLIGNTPLVRLQRIGTELGRTLLAKLEYLNPGGSNKDRIGLRMIERAEAEGKLSPAARSSSRPRATRASASRWRRRSRATG